MISKFPSESDNTHKLGGIEEGALLVNRCDQSPLGPDALSDTQDAVHAEEIGPHFAVLGEHVVRHHPIHQTVDDVSEEIYVGFVGQVDRSEGTRKTVRSAKK